MNASKVRALLQRRTFVLPDDVRLLCPYVLEHRLLMTPEAELEGSTARGVIAEALATVDFSRER